MNFDWNSLKFVPKGLINNIPILDQILSWRRPGNKPLSEPIMFSLLTHICVTRSQWVKQWLVMCVPFCFPRHVEIKPCKMNNDHQKFLLPLVVAPRTISYANPVYGVATICHQVRWLRWGHPSLFHTATSLVIWYKMFCVRDISYRLIWMEFINTFSVYAQSGTHSRFNWWIIVVLTHNPSVLMYVEITDAPKL